MFTPPPSPAPPRAQELSFDQPAPAVSLEPPQNAELKRRRTSRIRWSILAVPAILVLITLTTRCISHPALFDPISEFLHELHDSIEFNDWGIHIRHPNPEHLAASHAARANNDPSPSVTTVPTIPVNPPIPTPFPQPFDTTLPKNFSTQACVDFYTNMTLSPQFRQCRPFGLLSEYSSQFIDVSRRGKGFRAELTVPKAGTDQRDVTEQHGLGHLQYGSRQRRLFQEHGIVRVLAQNPMCHRARPTESIHDKDAPRSRALWPFPAVGVSIKFSHKRLLLHRSSLVIGPLRPVLLSDTIRSYDP